MAKAPDASKIDKATLESAMQKLGDSLEQRAGKIQPGWEHGAQRNKLALSLKDAGMTAAEQEALTSALGKYSPQIEGDVLTIVKPGKYNFSDRGSAKFINSMNRELQGTVNAAGNIPIPSPEAIIPDTPIEAPVIGSSEIMGSGTGVIESGPVMGSDPTSLGSVSSVIPDEGNASNTSSSTGSDTQASDTQAAPVTSLAPTVDTPTVETPHVEPTVVTEPVIGSGEIMGSGAGVIESGPVMGSDTTSLGSISSSNTGGDVEAAPVTNLAPTVDTPTVETPHVETPIVEAPEVKTPEVKTPVVEAPVVETPHVEAAEIKAPEVRVPEVTPVIAAEPAHIDTAHIDTVIENAPVETRPNPAPTQHVEPTVERKPPAQQPPRKDPPAPRKDPVVEHTPGGNPPPRKDPPAPRRETTVPHEPVQPNGHTPSGGPPHNNPATPPNSHIEVPHEPLAPPIVHEPVVPPVIPASDALRAGEQALERQGAQALERQAVQTVAKAESKFLPAIGKIISHHPVLSTAAVLGGLAAGYGAYKMFSGGSDKKEMSHAERLRQERVPAIRQPSGMAFAAAPDIYAGAMHVNDRSMQQGIGEGMSR